MTNDTVKTKEYPELWIDPALRDFCISSYHESPDPGIEHFLILYIMAHRIWNGEYKNWCDLPLRDIAKHSKFGVKRLQLALDHLEAIGIVRGSSKNSLAAVRRLPKRYKLMSKTQRWPTTPSSNSAVAKEVERKVESTRSRPSTESKKPPLHTVATQPVLNNEQMKDINEQAYQDWLKMTPERRIKYNEMRTSPLIGLKALVLREGDV